MLQVACFAFLLAATTGGCSSDDSSGGGGSGGSDCNTVQCFADNQCVKQCGDTPQSSGCCPCPSGTINVSTCGSDGGGGSSGSGGQPGDGGAADASCTPDPNAGTVPCGAMDCNSCQVCVTPCCSAPDGAACKPAPPFCADSYSVDCPLGGGPQAICKHTDSDCSGVLANGTLTCQCQ